MMSERRALQEAADLAIDGLAAYRLARLVTHDTITKPWRDEIVATLGPTTLLAEGLTCDWCISVWAAFGMRLLPRWVRRALAVAALAGLIAERE